ncbi:phosphatidylinositol-glycan biosynthesis class X protein [Talpa occidentalis]|uniref:phosphatidylinositol-glycan biosynthesis class X protein n=1 Tax=Talpa occidentalis TaxID=50954 RepID=UPI00188EFA08|nr:phosphatidylinositol-glycan biosynthesis class X protein [Talpa occidentalis]
MQEKATATPGRRHCWVTSRQEVGIRKYLQAWRRRPRANSLLGSLDSARPWRKSRRLRGSAPRPAPSAGGGAARGVTEGVTEGAGRAAEPARRGPGERGSCGRPACAHRDFRPAAVPRSRERRAQASRPRVVPARPLGRPLPGVLAARAVTAQAGAWLLLWATGGLACTPASAFTSARPDAGKGSDGAAGVRARFEDHEGGEQFWASASDPRTVGHKVTCSEITLRQDVLKDGFHRDLVIKVKFGESIEDLQTCRLLIKQLIPTGLFVDPYELASLQERNITEAVMVSEDFNIEAPNYLSKESEVLIYARQDSQCIDCFQAFLPLHYRYHRPHSKDGETFIVVKKPDLLMYCDQEFPILKCWSQSEVAAPCALKSKDICQWNNMKYKSVYKNVTLHVPVGLTIHTSLVCSVTLLVTILCSTLILVAVFKYGHFSL